jgi:DNA-binding NarL/FixJ family response regulator
MARFAIATGSALVKLGFQSLAATDDALDFVGEADAPESLLALVRGRDPDVVAIDQAAFGEGFVGLCKQLARDHPNTALLVLLANQDPRTLKQVLDCGVMGVVSNEATPDDLRHALSHIAEGRMVIDPRVTSHVVSWALGHEPPTGHRLTPKELEIVRRAAAGATNGEISVGLGISQSTVKSHLRSAYDKLGCRNRAEASAALGRLGLV